MDSCFCKWQLNLPCMQKIFSTAIMTVNHKVHRYPVNFTTEWELCHRVAGLKYATHKINPMWRLSLAPQSCSRLNKKFVLTTQQIILESKAQSFPLYLLPSCSIAASLSLKSQKFPVIPITNYFYSVGIIKGELEFQKARRNTVSVWGGSRTEISSLKNQDTTCQFVNSEFKKKKSQSSSSCIQLSQHKLLCSIRHVAPPPGNPARPGICSKGCCESFLWQPVGGEEDMWEENVWRMWFSENISISLKVH